MKVSVITVTYNSENYIETCIKSVLNQSYSDIEYLIIDGASKDNTVNIIRSYGNRINKYISEPDMGIYDAMNKGIGLASGDIVAILNSDDLYADNSIIEKVVELFATSECEAVYGDLVYVDNKDINKVVRVWNAGEYKENSFIFGWMPPHPTFFVKRSLYNKYGRFNLMLKSAADYELMLRFIHKNRITIKYLPLLMVRMRSGGASNASLKNRLHANAEDRLAWKINGLNAYFITFIFKPLRKLKQFKFFR